jgi:hypothetical protein
MSILPMVIAFTVGAISGALLLIFIAHWDTIARAWRRRRAELRVWWSRNYGEYRRLERQAVPDGTLVRLVCREHCSFPATQHEGVWYTSWTPRRMNDIDTVDDYRLSRDPEGNGEATYATRGSFEVVEPEPKSR